ncbi:MAG TPA: thymidine kinase [Phycisphaerae bacterium]|nr:thymidine kinase [Phycisphaerae bacterium]
MNAYAEHEAGSPRSHMTGSDQTPDSSGANSPSSSPRPRPEHEPTDSRTGSVELICGCMFTGKTEELLRRIRAEPPGAAMVIKHARDNRYSTDRVVSHGQDSHPAVTVRQAADIPTLLTADHHLVAIDEGHFFDADLPEVCARLAAGGRRVIVTALDTNSWGRPFPQVEALKRAADTTLLKTAPCARCGGEATRTQRLTPIVSGNIIGGPESFEPRCLRCWSPPPEPTVD